MATDEELMAMKHKENEECLNRLQDFVQKKIVPIDPDFIIGRLGTVDLAIEYYIGLLEIEIAELKKQKNGN